MKVGLVIQKLAGLRGGAERVLVDLAIALEERGHEVTVLTFEPPNAAKGYASGLIETHNLFPRVAGRVLGGPGAESRVSSAETAVSSRLNIRGLSTVKWHATHGWFARRLGRWLRSNPQDVIVGFLPPAISAAAIAGHRTGATRPGIIASTHSVPSEDFGPNGRWDQNPVARRRNLQALARSDIVTVLQPEFVDDLADDVQGHAVVIPNAVERRHAIDGDRGPRILGVGSLTDVKRFDVLIESFALVAPDFPGWELVIYGEGPNRRDLEHRVDALGLRERVSLPGVIEDVGDAYTHARILGHPARFEGFGLAVAEAILHDVWVVAFASCPGVNRLVDPGATGALVEERADATTAFAEGLRAAMSSTSADDDRRRQARDALAAELSRQRVLDLWEDALRTAASRT